MTPAKAIPVGAPIPYGIHDVEHPQYGVAKTVVMGEGAVALTHIETNKGVSVGLATHAPMPIGTVSEELSKKLQPVRKIEVMLMFDKVESIAAVEAVLAHAKISLTKKVAASG